MLENIMNFEPTVPLDQREIYHCPNCQSRGFKFIMTGASREIAVECANCENVQTYFEVVEGSAK